MAGASSVMQGSKRIQALFISPHLDDVALSCGGTVAWHADRGEACLVVTVFAGEPPEEKEHSALVRSLGILQGAHRLSPRELVRLRQEEDTSACRILGADRLPLPYLDAPFRGGQDWSPRDLFREWSEEDAALLSLISAELVELWRWTDHARVYLPLGVGGHVDHRLCAALSPAMKQVGAEVWHYEDFPYAAAVPGTILRQLESHSRSLKPRFVDITSTLQRRIEAVSCYGSQLDMLFKRLGLPELVIRDYALGRSREPGRCVERFWC